MTNKQRIAVVTGGNRGIGFEICRQLARKKAITVILTSRDEHKGREACQYLQKQELPVHFLPLDVSSASSIQKFGRQLAKEFGRCDILVNNAGVFVDRGVAGAENFTGIFQAKVDDIRTTMETNVYGPLLLCQTLIPLMKKNNYGRIVNMSSGMGQLAEMGGGYTAYRLSKVSLNALTRIFHAELTGTNILMNSMCPGWVKTEMGGPNATRSVEQGADTAVWLATLPDKAASGKFFRDRKEILW